MPQFARPTADVTLGDWVPAPLHTRLGGTTPDDAARIDALGPTSAVVRLTPISTPAAGAVTLRVRYRRPTTHPFALLTIDLLSGATIAATRTLYPLSTAYGTVDLVLSAGERDAIADWADLTVRLTAAPYPSSAVTYDGQPVTYAGELVTYTP